MGHLGNPDRERTFPRHLLYESRVAWRIPQRPAPRVSRHLPSLERCRLFDRTRICATLYLERMARRAGNGVVPYSDNTACTDM